MINISHCSQNGAQYLKHVGCWRGLVLCSQAYRSRFASAQAYLYLFLLLSAENIAHIQVMLSHNSRQDDSDHHVHCFAAVSSRQSTLQDLEQLQIEFVSVPKLSVVFVSFDFSTILIISSDDSNVCGTQDEK